MFTTVTGHTQYGFLVGGFGQMTIESSVARANKLAGLYVGYGTARISNSVFTQGDAGIARSDEGIILTRENNLVSGNMVNVVGTPTPLAGK